MRTTNGQHVGPLHKALGAAIAGGATDINADVRAVLEQAQGIARGMASTGWMLPALTAEQRTHDAALRVAHLLADALGMLGGNDHAR